MFSSAYWLLGSMPDDLVERFERAIDESSALEVEAETEQDVRLLETRQARALQQALVDVDGARDLPFFAIEAAEQQVYFERVAEAFGGLAQLVDGEIDLIGDEEVQADDVVQRFRDARRRSISRPDAQLVALPGFPDREADEQRDERGEKRVVSAQNSSVRQRSCR